MLLGLCGAAWAGAFTLVDSGVRAQGRAGAFVAGADDVSALWYNPAALANVHRPTVKFDLWAAGQSASFDREDLLGTNPFAEVGTAADPIPEPAGGFVAGLGGFSPTLAHTTVGFGLTVPTGADLDWPADGPQRYALISSAIRQIYVGPAVAQEVTSWLVLGAGVQYTLLSVDESLVATLCNAESPEQCGSDSPTDDVRLDISAVDPARITWNAGAIVRPATWLDIGASVQPGVHFAAKGSVTSTISDDNSTVRPYLTGSTFSDDHVTVSVDLPWTVRVGAQVSPSDSVRLELDGTWTGWSATDALRVTDVNLELTTPPDGPTHGASVMVSDDVALPTGFVDNWSVRLGGEWDVAKPLTLRAGVYGESSAVPDAMASANVVDGDKGGVGLGFSARIGPHLVVDGSGLVSGWLDRSVGTSGYAQPALFVDYSASFDTTVGFGRTVGDGDYTSMAWVAGLGVGWAFGGNAP